MRDLLSRDSPQMRELADSLLGVACREMGVELDRRQLLAGCEAALGAIHEGGWSEGGWGLGLGAGG